MYTFYVNTTRKLFITYGQKPSIMKDFRQTIDGHKALHNHRVRNHYWQVFSKRLSVITDSHFCRKLPVAFALGNFRWIRWKWPSVTTYNQLRRKWWQLLMSWATETVIFLKKRTIMCLLLTASVDTGWFFLICVIRLLITKVVIKLNKWCH